MKVGRRADVEDMLIEIEMAIKSDIICEQVRAVHTWFYDIIIDDSLKLLPPANNLTRTKQYTCFFCCPIPQKLINKNIFSVLHHKIIHDKRVL